LNNPDADLDQLSALTAKCALSHLSGKEQSSVHARTCTIINNRCVQYIGRIPN